MCTGIGAGIEDVDGQTLSNILLQADRIAMITPENGNTTPLFVAQGNQLFMNERVPEATVCGEHHVIRQSSYVFPDAGWQAGSPQCGYQWSHHGEYRHAQ